MPARPAISLLPLRPVHRWARPWFKGGSYALIGATAVLAPSLVAGALATLGGELGGRLVYRRGIGIDAPTSSKPRRGDAPAIAERTAERNA